MEKCACSSIPTLFFSCSGGSHVGQIANDVCRQMTAEGKGKLFCLAGIGAHVSGMVESAKAATKVVAIDGCGVQCAKKTLDAAAVPVSHHIVLTDAGFTKNPDLFPAAGDVQKAKTKVLAIVG